MFEREGKILITGGCGFIGSALIRKLLATTTATIINVDKLTYAASLESLASEIHHSNHFLEQVDICDRRALERIFRQHKPDAVIHLAAESHVDRSIDSPAAFVRTNILGTYTLLEVALAYWSELGVEQKDQFRFHHVSTDEVYGDLGPEGPAFTETTPYAPSSPYSASKASSDHLARAWYRTYGLPLVITNCSNNYGPYQFPEKLIPLVILNALEGKHLPVYGAGINVRDWLYVEDHVGALCLVLAQGQIGRTYNIGGGDQQTNLSVVRSICARLDDLAPDPLGPHERLIRFVADRPGHDVRYAIDSSRITRELGWEPKETFSTGMDKTVRWYLDHREWVDRIRTGEYQEWLEKNYGSRETAK